jgi:hypothetical protein
MNRTWRVAWWALVLGAAFPLFAGAANIKIESQPLGSALQDLAKQSGVQIIFFSRTVEGRRAVALTGTYTTEEALALLLEGSGLAYHMLNERTIEVTAKPASPMAPPTIAVAAAPLDEVEVIAQREKIETMREELQNLDEKLYAEYNRLNSSPEYNIVCTTERRGGQRGTQRICEPAFVKDETRAAEVARRNDPCAPSAMRAVLAKMADHQKNVMDVIERHPELAALLLERNEVAHRYEALRNESRPGASNEVVKTAISSSHASAAALVASLGKCRSKDRALAGLSMQEWAVTQGLERVEIEGKQYFCLPQPGVAQPIRNSATCAALVDLRRARWEPPPERPLVLFDGLRPRPWEGTGVARPRASRAISFEEQAALHGVPGYPK